MSVAVAQATCTLLYLSFLSVKLFCGFCKGVALGVIIGAIALALVLEWLTSEEVALAGRGAVADGPGSRLADEPEFAEGSR